MPNMEFQRAVPQVVDQYVESRKKSDWPISTTHALRAIRTALPRCELSDRQLVDMVAFSAISRGRNVAFDLPGEVSHTTHPLPKPADGTIPPQVVSSRIAVSRH
jgi:hypothetical protein